jgi:hypothetical protein
MVQTGEVSTRTYHFRSFAAAVMIAIVTLVAFTELAHAHARSHTDERSGAAALLAQIATDLAETTQSDCHGGGLGIACGFGALLEHDRGLLSIFPQSPAVRLPTNSVQFSSFAHAPPNPPPISIRF